MPSTLAAASTTAASSSSSTSSPRCVPFAFRRGGGRTRTVTTHGGAPAAATGGCGCGRPLCRPAGVLGEGIQSAFFTSLDVCSCVKVGTKSFKESESDDAAPLMSPLPSPPPPHDAAPSGGRRGASGAGKPRRRGLGCCTPSSTSVN
ncbi:hypothetical protein SORBI_3008G187700 [Sorghum bicolor]|uniref:Uncharacterized protein n=1 Tax=Sorghum bicolor TaxID=4558 RepID=A0A1Z5R7N5_SORBI|nr:hypothetical protein SORBI_3008G187700 [Sorghum bicolor]